MPRRAEIGEAKHSHAHSDLTAMKMGSLLSASRNVCIRTAEAVRAIKRDYLPIPFVSASADGGITLEWRKPASRLTINIRAIGEVGYFGAREPNYTCEGELTDGNFDFINEVVDILLVR